MFNQAQNAVLLDVFHLFYTSYKILVKIYTICDSINTFPARSFFR